MKKFIQARWKALMPLVALGLSEALNLGFDLKTPAGWKQLGFAVVAAVLVHIKANKPA